MHVRQAPDHARALYRGRGEGNRSGCAAYAGDLRHAPGYEAQGR